MSSLLRKCVVLWFVIVVVKLDTMAVYKVAVIVLGLVCLVQSQRPFFAGLRPIGYPALESDTIDQLSNRFGEDEPVPIEAKGDRKLINRIESLPKDSQPIWYLNAVQYDALRKQPQTWPLKPNNFISK